MVVKCVFKHKIQKLLWTSISAAAGAIDFPLKLIADTKTYMKCLPSHSMPVVAINNVDL